MVVTNPDVHPYQGSSMFVVPTDTPGLNVVRDVPVMSHPDHETGEPGGHSEIVYDNVRIPHANLVGGDDGVGQGLCSRPETARTWPDPPRDALARPIAACVRHAV